MSKGDELWIGYCDNKRETYGEIHWGVESEIYNRNVSKKRRIPIGKEKDVDERERAFPYFSILLRKCYYMVIVEERF